MEFCGISKSIRLRNVHFLLKSRNSKSCVYMNVCVSSGALAHVRCDYLLIETRHNTKILQNAGMVRSAYVFSSSESIHFLAKKNYWILPFSHLMPQMLCLNRNINI